MCLEGTKRLLQQFKASKEVYVYGYKVLKLDLDNELKATYHSDYYYGVGWNEADEIHVTDDGWRGTRIVVENAIHFCRTIGSAKRFAEKRIRTSSCRHVVVKVRARLKDVVGVNRRDIAASKVYLTKKSILKVMKHAHRSN